MQFDETIGLVTDCRGQEVRDRRAASAYGGVDSPGVLVEYCPGVAGTRLIVAAAATFGRIAQADQ
ncbi:MAG: hypothetical protein AMXMBFR45_23930 [Gammaproteobacteria bacterium]